MLRSLCSPGHPQCVRIDSPPGMATTQSRIMCSPGPPLSEPRSPEPAEYTSWDILYHHETTRCAREVVVDGACLTDRVADGSWAGTPATPLGLMSLFLVSLVTGRATFSRLEMATGITLPLWTFDTVTPATNAG